MKTPMNGITTRFASVWDALAANAEEAANLKLRAELMRKIAVLLQHSGWTQAAAAEHCGVSQNRASMTCCVGASRASRWMRW